MHVIGQQGSLSIWRESAQTLLTCVQNKPQAKLVLVPEAVLGWFSSYLLASPLLQMSCHCVTMRHHCTDKTAYHMFTTTMQGADQMKSTCCGYSSFPWSYSTEATQCIWGCKWWPWLWRTSPAANLCLKSTALEHMKKHKELVFSQAPAPIFNQLLEKLWERQGSGDQIFLMWGDTVCFKSSESVPEPKRQTLTEGLFYNLLLVTRLTFQGCPCETKTNISILLTRWRSFPSKHCPVEK